MFTLFHLTGISELIITLPVIFKLYYFASFSAFLEFSSISTYAYHLREFKLFPVNLFPNSSK